LRRRLLLLRLLLLLLLRRWLLRLRLSGGRLRRGRLLRAFLDGLFAVRLLGGGDVICGLAPGRAFVRHESTGAVDLVRS
jgi:hypothetical protein